MSVHGIPKYLDRKKKKEPDRVSIVGPKQNIRQAEWKMQGPTLGVRCPFCGGLLVHRGYVTTVRCRICEAEFAVEVDSFKLVYKEFI